MAGLPRSGDILRIDREVSVQFINPFFYRVIRCHDWPTYEGWVWLDGYQLNNHGDAVSRRTIWVQIAGLKPGKPDGFPVRPATRRTPRSEALGRPMPVARQPDAGRSHRMRSVVHLGAAPS